MIVVHSCAAENPRSCYYWLWLEVKDEAGASTHLVKEADGWYATFPDRSYTCGHTRTGWIYRPQHTTIILRFHDGGRAVEGRERTYSWAAGCGYGTSEAELTGSTFEPSSGFLNST